MKILNYNKEFFLCLIEKLNESNIKYCIIGDYENLPQSINHDIDIWTNNVSFFRKSLFSAIKENDFNVLIDNKTANGCNVAFYKREFETIFLIKIDVLTDTSYKSVLTLIDEELTATNAIPYKNFYIANPESEAVMHFLYPMFEWGFIKKDIYKADIIKYHHHEIFNKAFLKIWGESTTNCLQKLIEEERWRDIEKMMGKLKRKAILRALGKASTYTNIFHTIYFLLLRWIRPSGMCIAFCGLDGAGKTTILDELNEMFVNLLKQKKVYYGYWRPFVIPEIRELFGKKNSKSNVDAKAQKGVTIVEQDKKTKNKFISFVKLIYYWLDYLLAPIKYGNIRNLGGMVFFDRHYIDMAVHPQRFEMGLSRKLILFMYRFIPKADYTFFLYCTPKEIHERKQEFTFKEIEEQTERYLEAGKKIKNFIPIHTNTSIVEEIDEILSHIARSNNDY